MGKCKCGKEAGKFLLCKQCEKEHTKFLDMLENPPSVQFKGNGFTKNDQ